MKPFYVRKRSKKPFKSKLKVNTIKSDTFIHPITGNPCYEFNEDDSYVEQRMCCILTTEEIIIHLMDIYLKPYDTDKWQSLLDSSNKTRKLLCKFETLREPLEHCKGLEKTNFPVIKKLPY